jgi:hypothetical protein
MEDCKFQLGQASVLQEDLSDCINKLKKSVSALEQDLGLAIDRIHKLEKENLMRHNTIDEAFEEIYDQLETLEGYTTMEDRITASDVLLRLKKLESVDLMKNLDRQVWVFVNERLIKLEKHLKL